MSKLLFPDISTTIVSQKIFWGLDELLSFVIFWVKAFFFFFCTALFQFSRQRADAADDSAAAVPSPALRPRCQRLCVSEKVTVRLDLTSCLHTRTHTELDPTPELGRVILKVRCGLLLHFHRGKKQ